MHVPIILQPAEPLLKGCADMQFFWIYLHFSIFLDKLKCYISAQELGMDSKIAENG